jgi:putative endonuclease
MAYYVYLLASKKHGTLYLGVTNDIVRRGYEHRTKAAQGFTKRYSVDKLVWFEIYDDAISAIAREKELKKWRRDWKIRLIERGKSRMGRSLSRHFKLTSWLWIPGPRQGASRNSCGFTLIRHSGATRSVEPGIHNHHREYGFRARAKRRAPE